MEHTLDYCSDGSYFLITTAGDPEPAGFANYLDDLVNHPVWDSGMPWLVDLRKLNISILNSSDVREIGDAHVPFSDQIAECRIGAVVALASHFGMGRMFQGVTNDMLRNLHFFYTMEKAEAWVISGHLDPE